MRELCLAFVVASMGFTAMYVGSSPPVLARSGDAQIILQEQTKLDTVCEGVGELCWPALKVERRGWLEVEGFDRIPLRGRFQADRSVVLTQDETGSRFAYRLEGSPWLRVERGETGAIFIWKTSKTDPTFDWDHAASFEASAAEIFRQGSFERQRAVVKEMKARGLHRALPQLLWDTLDVHPRGRSRAARRADGVWGEVFRSLSPCAQARLRFAMTRLFLHKPLQSTALVRTLRYIDFSDPDVLDRMESRVAELAPQTQHRAVEVMLGGLMNHRPDAAARVGCWALGSISPQALVMEDKYAWYHQQVLAATAGGRCGAAKTAAQTVFGPRDFTAGALDWARVENVQSRDPQAWSFGSQRSTRPDARHLLSLLRAAAEGTARERSGCIWRGGRPHNR